MSDFAIRHHECGDCGFAVEHKTWEFSFLPYGMYGLDINGQPYTVDGVKIYTEDGELIVEAPGEGKWALCSTSPVTMEAKRFYWFCRPFSLEADDPCDSEFMEDISS